MLTSITGGTSSCSKDTENELPNANTLNNDSTDGTAWESVRRVGFTGFYY